MKNFLKATAILSISILGITPQLSNLNAQALPNLNNHHHVVTAQLNYLVPVSTVQRVSIRPEKPGVVSFVMIR